MKNDFTVTHAEVCELFDYDSSTGFFFRKKASRDNRFKSGTIAGYLNGRCYVLITIRDKRYMAHRLAWFYIHGKWPENEIDHIDGCGTNNAISNLREATRWQNARNKPARGYYFSKYHQRYRAIITVNGKPIWLRYFDTAKEARSAYLIAQAEHAGEFSFVKSRGEQPAPTTSGA